MLDQSSQRARVHACCSGNYTQAGCSVVERFACNQPLILSNSCKCVALTQVNCLVNWKQISEDAPRSTMQATLAGHIPWQSFTIAASDAPHILTETARHCCLLVMYLIPGLQQNIYSCYPLSTTTMANETFRRSVKRSGVPHTIAAQHEVKCPGTSVQKVCLNH